MTDTPTPEDTPQIMRALTDPVGLLHEILDHLSHREQTIADLSRQVGDLVNAGLVREAELRNEAALLHAALEDAVKLMEQLVQLVPPGSPLQAHVLEWCAQVQTIMTR